jgi:hypothetical protein
MAWEERNGRSYYRKERNGGRVRSVYVGAGVMGRGLALLDGLDRAEAEERRAELMREREADLSEVVAEAQSETAPRRATCKSA